MHKRLFFRMRSLLSAGTLLTQEGTTPMDVFPKEQRPRRLVIKGRCEAVDGVLRHVGVYNHASKQYTVPLLYTSPQGVTRNASVLSDRPLYGVDGYACDELNVTGGRLTVRTACVNLADVREEISIFERRDGRLIYAYQLPADAQATTNRAACASAYFTVCANATEVGEREFGCSTDIHGKMLIFTLSMAIHTVEDAKAYLMGKDARIVYVRAVEKVLPYRAVAARLFAPACRISMREGPQTTVSVTYLPYEGVV